MMHLHGAGVSRAELLLLEKLLKKIRQQKAAVIFGNSVAPTVLGSDESWMIFLAWCKFWNVTKLFWLLQNMFWIFSRKVLESMFLHVHTSAIHCLSPICVS